MILGSRTTRIPRPRLSTLRGPRQQDVDALRELLDLMADFEDNDQRARYLLSSNWLRDQGSVAATHLRDSLAEAGVLA